MSESEFDGDAFLASLALPTLKLNGRTHTGRLLTFEEYMSFKERLTGPGAGISGDAVVDPRRFRGLVRDITALTFGRGRPWWAFWRPTIAEELTAAPFVLQIEALKSFSASQTAKFVADAERLTNSPGTTSSTP